MLGYRNVSQIETRWSGKRKDTKCIAGKMGTWQGKKRCKGSSCLQLIAPNLMLTNGMFMSNNGAQAA